MTVIISNVRQDSANGNFDLVADITFAGIKKTAVLSRFGNAPKLFDTHARAEPFAVMMLAPAMLASEPMVIEADVDPNLVFQLNGVVQNMIKAVVPRMAKIKVDACVNLCPQSESVPSGTNIATRGGVEQASQLPAATGFSGGIDSSYVINRCFFKRDVPKNMQIGLLMHHNVGAFTSPQHYEDSLNQTKQWADAHNLPLVGARCDMSFWYQGMTFLQTHTMRNVAAALSLGHLYSEFLYASGYGIENILQKKLNDIDSLNLMLLPLLQVRHNRFRLFGMEYTRSEKTVVVMSDDLLNESLNVCCRLKRRDHQYLNCGTCIKCSRVIMVAESMGKLDQLRKNFDLNAYHAHRSRCLLNFLYGTLRPGGNTANRALIHYLLETNYRFPAAIRPLLAMVA